MKCQEIIEVIESRFSRDYACDWDNVGLLAGRKNREVRKVYIALDATEREIDTAVRYQADFLLTHHPLIFSGMKKISEDDFIGRRLIKLLEHRISCYAMHTNFDVMGMADAAADLLKLHHCQVLEVTYEDEVSKEGIGRIGRLPHEMS